MTNPDTGKDLLDHPVRRREDTYNESRGKAENRYVKSMLKMLKSSDKEMDLVLDVLEKEGLYVGRYDANTQVDTAFAKKNMSDIFKTVANGRVEFEKKRKELEKEPVARADYKEVRGGYYAAGM